VFTVKSAYKILKESAQGEEGDLYVGFWKVKAQSSALVTTWRVLEDKILSRGNLARRGIRMDSCICYLCGEEEETTSHLFCTCRVAWLVWFKCYERIGMTSTDPWEPKMHFLNFKSSGANKSVNQIWGCVWVVVVAELWNHRNRKILKSGTINHIEIFTMV